MKKLALITVTIILSVFLLGCSTGVETSDPPGVLKVYLQPSEADTNLTIVNTNYTIDPKDEFMIQVSEGKAYQDSTFFILYRNLDTFTERDIVRDLLSGVNNENYERQLIYETYLPVGVYSKLEFFLSSSLFQLDGFEVPVVTPTGQPIPIKKEEEFSIFENDTTSIYLEIEIVESVTRYRDTYVFDPDPNILKIERSQ